MSLVSKVVSDTMVIEDLPNLKIEIENDLEGKMDTDDENDGICEKAQRTVSSEAEEGELVDDDDDDLIVTLLRTSNPRAVRNDAIEPVNCPVPMGRSILKYDSKEYVEPQIHHNAVKNPNGGFTTGVDIFSREEQAKLDTRALRFGIEASESKVMTENLLKKLYKSMDVKPSDETIRLDALHMQGTEQMVTQDVFNYFKDYGPASLEWINDHSCNVVWLDSVSAARALMGLSVHIRGQEGRGQQSRGGEKGQTTRHRGLLSDIDMEMVSETPKLAADKKDDDDNGYLSEESDACDIDSLSVDLPPGRWRRGGPDPLSPCILLRFASTSDRTQPKQQGYTKFGKHSFGGLISESRKRRLQGIAPNPIFEDVGDEILPKPAIEETNSANPWGMLAKTWSCFDKVRKPRPPSPVIHRVVPLPPRMTPPPSPPSFLMNRVRLVPHTRMRREQEIAARHVSDPDPSDSSDGEEWSSRSKVPRMRMHADDEEKKRDKKVKRSHDNRMFSGSSPRGNIRHRIGATRPIMGGKSSPEPVVEEPDDEKDVEEDEVEIPDLRVAVPAECSSSPDETKEGLQERLFNTAGNVKSVLRGARGHSNDEDEEEEEEEGEADKESRRHQSRQTERRKQHRKHKESTHHKSRRRDESDSDTNNMSGKLRSTIRRKSPIGKEKKDYEDKKRSRHGTRMKSTSWRRGRKDDEYKRHKVEHRKSDQPSRRHKGGADVRVSKDLRLKIAHSKTYDFENEFRSKSPLQIEIDNDEYFNKNSHIESD